MIENDDEIRLPEGTIHLKIFLIASKNNIVIRDTFAQFSFEWKLLPLH